MHVDHPTLLEHLGIFLLPFLGHSLSQLRDLCTGLFKQLKSTQPCFLPAHICMQAHTQAVSDTYKSFFLRSLSLSLSLSLPSSHSRAQVGPITKKSNTKRKIEQETRLLAGINFSSINTILL